MIAYFTDVEGRWDKLATFTENNPHVTISPNGAALDLADGVTFVFGGDAIDRGPAGRRIVDVLLATRAKYGKRVVLLAGNRDLNKLRLPSELNGAPPPKPPPPGLPRGELLRWILANTMGAAKAFEYRAAEIGAAAGAAGDDAVIESYLADVAPGGPLRRYLEACQLGYRSGATLFLHGGVTGHNFGVVPGHVAPADDVDTWLARLDEFYREELAGVAAGRFPERLMAYQAPLPGTKENQASVVYGRPTDENANPRLPPDDVVARLRASGIGRLVVGHTPSGDSPSVVRDGDFELVLADNSYGRVERGSQLAFTDAETHVRATAQLDDGSLVAIDTVLARADAAGSPVGRRDAATGQLVKTPLADGAYLMFRGLPERKIEQLAASDVAARTLVRAS